MAQGAKWECLRKARKRHYHLGNHKPSYPSHPARQPLTKVNHDSKWRNMDPHLSWKEPQRIQRDVLKCRHDRGKFWAYKKCWLSTKKTPGSDFVVIPSRSFLRPLLCVPILCGAKCVTTYCCLLFCKEGLHSLKPWATNYIIQWMNQLSILPPTVFLPWANSRERWNPHLLWNKSWATVYIETEPGGVYTCQRESRKQSYKMWSQSSIYKGNSHESEGPQGPTVIQKKNDWQILPVSQQA